MGGVLLFLVSDASAQPLSEAQQDVWRLEEAYWDYVAANDIEGFKSLWHPDFVGWPGGAPAPVGVANIADWIEELHRDPARRYDYELRRVAVVPFGDDVMVTYYGQADYFILVGSGERRLDGYWKLTHTWKRDGDHWQIIGGMASELAALPSGP